MRKSTITKFKLNIYLNALNNIKQTSL